MFSSSLQYNPIVVQHIKDRFFLPFIFSTKAFISVSFHSQSVHSKTFKNNPQTVEG